MTQIKCCCRSSEKKCHCRSIGAADSSSSSSGTSDSGSSIYSWISIGSSRYKNQLDQLLETIPFYYGSMLDDVEIQTQLLAKPGGGLLKLSIAAFFQFVVLLKMNSLLYITVLVVYFRRCLSDLISVGQGRCRSSTYSLQKVASCRAKNEQHYM